MQKLYFGDCLDVTQEHIPDQSVDLVYLDPPFNSNRDYNLLSSKIGKESAKVPAFLDTWYWGIDTQQEFNEISQGPHPEVAQTMKALYSILGPVPMMAYLVMMGRRLLDVHRTMKPTASLYLHCDVSASHYLKILLDALFGAKNFRNEIVWHYYNKYSAGKRLFGKNFDQILFYTKGEQYTFHPQREEREKPVKQLLRENIGGVLKNKKGADGRVMYREVSDKKVDAVWRMPCLQPAAKEMLGYPTQKPQALLERIIQTSSNPGDVVLDPFCGCGTTLHSSQNLERNWIGVDMNQVAIQMVQDRLNKAFPDLRYQTIGMPVGSVEQVAKKKKNQSQGQQQELPLLGGEAPPKQKRIRRKAPPVTKLEDVAMRRSKKDQVEKVSLQSKQKNVVGS